MELDDVNQVWIAYENAYFRDMHDVIMIGGTDKKITVKTTFQG